MRGRRAGVLLPVAALLVLAAWSRALPGARADVEETERRLKTTGIEAPLRARIHEAIDRAVAYLRAQQRSDGGFGAGPDDAGRSALCALALRHAGTPSALQGVERARAHLFPEGRRTASALLGDVYAAGLALVFLRADRPFTETHDGVRHVKRLLLALASAQHEKSGQWSYATPYASPLSGASRRGVLPNLSTSQFAALGLWAAQPFVSERPVPVWRRHLLSLLALSTPDGSWPYGTDDVGAFGYPTGTTMGLADLVLAEAALGEDDPVIRKTREERLDVHGRALAALRRQCPWTLYGYNRISYPFYALYALEKACVFLGIERIGEIEWYREGATRLLAYQGDDGGWNRTTWTRAQPDASATSDVVGSAFALLFLLRSPESLRPVTPSPVDHEEPVVTEPAAPAKAPSPAPASAPPPGIRLSRAKAALDALRDALADPRAANDALLALLDRVGEAYAHLVPDAGLERIFDALARRWRTEAEGVLLQAFTLVRRGPDGSNERGPVNANAATILGHTDRRVSDALRQGLLETHVKGPTPAAAPVLGVAFDALADLGDPASARWLAEELLDTDQRPERRERAERLLRALARFATLPGDVRYEVSERILRAFEGIERTSQSPAPGGNRKRVRALATARYWEWVRYDAVVALRALATDPVTDEPARQADGTPIWDLVAFRRFFNDHKDPAGAPWHAKR